uniref:AAA ATPase AAA+ lid domain-containing protein n=1 Tax=Fagus sylvatica TaxID=28930 RepID=A0A2N9H6E7_FAGSY
MRSADENQEGVSREEFRSGRSTATNRIESLDPALLRPGQIDKKIEFPLPDIKTRRRIFQIHTSRMTLADDVNLEEFVMTKDEFSGAYIKAICTEAGLLALRERRMKVTHADFKKAKEKVMFKKKEGLLGGDFFMRWCGWLWGIWNLVDLVVQVPIWNLTELNDTLPGLRPHEVSFLRLIEKSYDD